jgi:CheY-like chemotaxis protein
MQIMTTNKRHDSSILVATNNQDVHAFTTETLEEGGYSVRTTTAQNLVRAIKRGRPALLVIDAGQHPIYALPILEELRQNDFGGIRVLLLTTYTALDPLEKDAELNKVSSKYNVHRIIPLPFDIDEFLSRVEATYPKPALPVSQTYQRPRHKVRAHSNPASGKGEETSGANYPSMSTVRWRLAITFVVLVGLSGLGATVFPGAVPVFDKLLPVLMFAVGFYFNKS